MKRHTFLRLGLSAWTLAALGAVTVLGGCASTPAQPSLDDAPPIVFVHGNGDTAALWSTTLWRFESNGWPRERLFAFDMPYPLARDDDRTAQPGRSSTTEHMQRLRAEVERAMAATGARKVLLVGNSRGGNAIRNYIQNGGGSATVSHAVLGGTPNHGVWAVKGFREGNEFAGTGAFLTGLNAPKGPNGDEVTPGVAWLTIRSLDNDKFAQSDGLWIGARGTATNVGYDGPALKGATNVVIPKIDHRETSYSPQAFEATYRFITGRAPRTLEITPEAAPVLDGAVTGLGVNPADATSGNFTNNLPVTGATVAVYAVDAEGRRQGDAVHRRTTAADGRWGPFTARAGQAYEFEVSAPGYATTHIYRSPFARSSALVHLRAERVAAADRDGAAVVSFVRPRGYFDAGRDRMAFDGRTPPPGVTPHSSGTGGAGVASSKIKYPELPARAVAAEFNGERVVGRAWPLSENRLTVLEVHQ